MSKDEKKIAAARARADALSTERKVEIARQGAQARWDRVKYIPKAEYTGEMRVGDVTFPCSVLSDGTRILAQSDFMTGMGMYYSGWVAQNRPKDGPAADLPHFLGFKSLEPFIAKHLGDLQSAMSSGSSAGSSTMARTIAASRALQSA